LPLDVTDHGQSSNVVRVAQERFGGIDVLVNNAGHSYRAAVEEAAEDQVQELFATNFFGPAALIRVVLPLMREHRSGRAAEAIITAVQSPSVPRLLVLGADALTQFRDAAQELNRDVDAWERTSLSTSFSS
jgi:NAD(P)-dependent dehydrogenase (short-subunit alcohol dehydrogenase family)